MTEVSMASHFPLLDKPRYAAAGKLVSNLEMKVAIDTRNQSNLSGLPFADHRSGDGEGARKGRTRRDLHSGTHCHVGVLQSASSHCGDHRQGRLVTNRCLGTAVNMVKPSA